MTTQCLKERCQAQSGSRWRKNMTGSTLRFRTFLFGVAALAMGVFATVQAETRSGLHGRYFMVVWSYQSQDNDVVKAHTFASFYSGDDLANGNINPATISWLP